MSGEAKMYTCFVCGKPTPNYHNGSYGDTVDTDVTATAYIEDIKYCPFCGEEL